MSRRQSRRSVSLPGPLYAAIHAAADAQGVPLARLVTETLAEKFMVTDIAEFIEAVLPLPAESRIVAGPPPEQTAFFGRVETPPAPLRAVPVNVPPADRVKGTDPAPHLSLWRSQAHAHARAAIARRDAPVKPVAIRSGFEETASGGQAIARPAHGDKLPPPDPSRSARNVVLL